MNLKKINNAIIKTLGDDVTYTTTGEIIKGVFDYEYIETFDHATRAPFLTICDNITGLARGDSFYISGELYEVVNIEPDGVGATRLQLKKA